MISCSGCSSAGSDLTLTVDVTEPVNSALDVDADDDGSGNYFDTDDDNDGVADDSDVYPTVADDDGDGYSELTVPPDCEDTNPGRSPGLAEICGDGTDQNCDYVDTSCDTDGDGLTDTDEASLGTDPNNSDTDGDGLSDSSEVTSGSNPLSVDTDGDGMPDGSDPDPLVALDLTPILGLLFSGDEDGDTYDSTDDGGTDCDDEDASVYSGATEVCGDGIDQDCSGADAVCAPVDTDGDGLTDDVEITEGSDPNDPSSTACVPPSSGTEWTVTRDCTFMQAKAWSGNLYVQNEALMTIPADVSLDMDFSGMKLEVEYGSGVLIEQGGTLH